MEALVAEEITDNIKAVPVLRAASHGEQIQLPGIRKAAILMVALGDEVAHKIFQTLPEADVQRLTAEIARVENVSAEIVQSVLQEFQQLLETQRYMASGGIEYATKVLVEAFGRQRAEELLLQVKRAEEASHGNLAMLQKVDPQQLGKFLNNEHPQTVALVLAHLDPKRGAQVIEALGSEKRVAAVARLAGMRQFSPEMAQKVAMVLHQRLESMADSVRESYSGYKAVADLLNRLEGDSARKILEAVEQDTPETAMNIRNLMFTFEDIVTVPDSGMREIVANADKRQLAVALKGTSDDLKAHVFRAMSERAAEMLKEEMDVMGPVRSREVAAAQQELLALARRLEAEGKVILKLEQGDGLML